MQQNMDQKGVIHTHPTPFPYHVCWWRAVRDVGQQTCVWTTELVVANDVGGLLGLIVVVL